MAPAAPAAAAAASGYTLHPKEHLQCQHTATTDYHAWENKKKWPFVLFAALCFTPPTNTI